jgi:dephospho-CoA kinase
VLIFISGSINAGKTTTSKLLAQELGWVNINVDDLTDKVSGFDIYRHLDLAMDLAINAINTITAEGKNVVANFVVREKDWKRFEHEIITHPIIFVTLSPVITVAQSQRGDRVLTDWELKRITLHYNEGIASPKYGYVVDNSALTPMETVKEIMKFVAQYLH